MCTIVHNFLYLSYYKIIFNLKWHIILKQISNKILYYELTLIIFIFNTVRTHKIFKFGNCVRLFR